MKHLKISDNKGHFSIDGEGWEELDKIEKDDLLKIVDLALGDAFEMDPFDKEALGNQAHRVIYKNLWEKLTELADGADRFKDESENLYREAIEKYGVDCQPSASPTLRDSTGN
jgi:hypothetical protein